MHIMYDAVMSQFASANAKHSLRCKYESDISAGSIV